MYNSIILYTITITYYNYSYLLLYIYIPYRLISFDDLYIYASMSSKLSLSLPGPFGKASTRLVGSLEIGSGGAGGQVSALGKWLCLRKGSQKTIEN